MAHMVKYPEMRESIIDVLRTLADTDYQRRMWVEQRGTHPDLIESLDANISALYDDTDVTEDTSGNIGITLENEREAEAIKALDRALGPLYDSLPPNIDDADVIVMPEWQNVIAAAKAALRIFLDTPESR